MKIVQTAARKFSITAKFIFSIIFVKVYKVIRRILLQFLKNLNQLKNSAIPQFHRHILENSSKLIRNL